MTRRPPAWAIVAIVITAGALAVAVYGGARAVVEVLRTLDAMSAVPADVPSDDERDDLIANGRAAASTAYWLGRRYRGLDLNAVRVEETSVTVGYGEQVCDTGCFYPVSVTTAVRRAASFPLRGDPRTDGEHPCPAVARGVPVNLCLGYEATVFAGDRMVLITASPDRQRAVIADLRPFGRTASPTSALPAPKPLPCRLWSRLALWYRIGLPLALRPRGSCP